MKTVDWYGDINGHLIGIVMKELIRRAMVIILEERFVFEAFQKEGISSRNDVVTSADFRAQRVIVKSLRECFPLFGIVAEEHTLRFPSTHPTHNFFFAVDPLDGTKAFERRQSHGIGAMLALVCDFEVIAACVGDVMSREIYYYRPGSLKAHRMSDFEHSEDLQIDHARPLSEQYVLLREQAGDHSEVIRCLVRKVRQGGLFKNLEVSGGSIGTGMARLWKGEVGAAVLPPGPQAPWDILPVIGLSRKLGFVFLEWDDTERGFVPAELPITDQVFVREKETLIIHGSRQPELLEWEKTLRKRHPFL